MTSTDYNRYYKDITFAADSIIEFYKKKGAYEKYYSELEYLIFINVYFEPSRKIILCDRKMPCLKKYRKYMYKNFPGFHQNKYVKRLNIKNKWHLKLLDTEQYWLMSLLSKCRQVMKK